MLGTFLLGVAAGWGAPYAEPKIRDALANMLPDDVPKEPVELRMVTFAICLTGAAILAAAFAGGQALPLAVGALLGVIGPRLVDKWKASKAPDYDS